MRPGRAIGAWTAGGVFAAALALPAPAHGQATVDDPDASAIQLMNRIDGPGVTLSNPDIPAANGSDSARMYGLFSNGIVGAGLDIDTGIVLTTGTVAEALTSNSSVGIGQGGTTAYADPDITAIDSSAIYNAAIFEVDVTLGAYETGLSIDFQFGSDEYPDYVGSQYNDIFGFFVSGPGITGSVNFAQAPLGGDVRINTINIGTVGCADDATPEDLSQSAYYQNNGHITSLPANCQDSSALPGPFPVVTEYNGITSKLTAERRGLIPGSTYRIKFAVADVADATYDTGVFIELIHGIYDHDHGDAPASYGDPRHAMASPLLLGTGRTAETAGYNDPNAAGDSDDGVSLPAFTRGQTATVSVDVAGTGGYLQSWFDWNGDGDFLDAGEQVVSDATDGGADDQDGATNGTIDIHVPVPLTATTSQTFARFRLSSETGLAPDTGEADDGEVEDYALTVAPAPSLAGSKSIAVFDPDGANEVYAVPGNDVIYTLTLTNEGGGATDADSVVLIDKLPGEVEFFNGDIDTGGPDVWPGTDPVGWDAGTTGLTLAWPADVGFSNAAGRPADFASCTYTPLAGYDPAVTYVCFNPKGAMAAGDPDPTATIAFRARIK